MASESNLDKALDLLTYLSMMDEPQNVAQLSRYLGVTRNTIYSMLTPLMKRNFVEKTDDGRYIAGFGLMNLVSNYQHQYPFLYIAEKYVRNLAEEIGRPISVLVYKSPLNCLKLYSSEDKINGSAGTLICASTTAPGKILLAAQPDEVIDKDLAERPIEAYTELTITDPEEMKRRIPGYRDAKVVIEFDEYYPGSGSIAAPIRNRTEKVIAALGMFLDNKPEQDVLDNYAAKLRLCALRISEELGSTQMNMV